MKFDSKLNYTVLTNKANKTFLEKFSGISVINEKLSFDELKKSLEFFPSKQVVFVETFSYLQKTEREAVIKMLELENVKFINVTSDVEEALYSDYVYVFDEDNMVLEGKTFEVLENEKKLKQLGYGLPFVTDLSRQLMIYELLDYPFYDVKDLVEELWS